MIQGIDLHIAGAGILEFAGILPSGCTNAEGKCGFDATDMKYNATSIEE